jgi:glycosyltransferase involved in cell wall biosynthesis
MNILFVTPSLPTKLNRIRSFCLIKTLSKNHRVHLLSLSKEKNHHSSFEEIKPLLSSVNIVYKSQFHSMIDCLLGIFSKKPLEIIHDKCKKMEDELYKIVSQEAIDLVYIKRLRSLQYLNKIKRDFKNVKIIVDTTDAMSLFYYKLYRAQNRFSWLSKIFYYTEYKKYKDYEKKYLQEIHTVISCSEVDCKYLEKITGRNISYVPNVALEPKQNEKNTSPTPDYYNSHLQANIKYDVILSGLMNKFVNIEAVRYFMNEIEPLIRKTLPDLTVLIVGPKPTKCIKRYAKSNSVIVTGHVPSLDEYIEASKVVICPVKTGTGTRNKILQAWSLKKPVVSTSEGAQGLDTSTLLIGDNPQDFANAVIKLLNDPDLAKNLGEKSKECQLNKYSEKVMEGKLTEIFNDLS